MPEQKQVSRRRSGTGLKARRLRRLVYESLENRHLLASIQGFVWHDLNQDAVFDTGEPVLSGRTVYLDQNINGSFDATEVSTPSQANGSYLFQGLSAGTYRVAVVGQNNWVQTTPRASKITAETAVAPMWRSRCGVRWDLRAEIF